MVWWARSCRETETGSLGLAALGAVDDRAALLEQPAEVVDLVLGHLGGTRGRVDLRAGDLLAEVGALDQGNNLWVLAVHLRCLVHSGVKAPCDGVCKEPTPAAERQIRTARFEQSLGTHPLRLCAGVVVELGRVESLSQAYPEHNPLEPAGFSVQALAARRGRLAGAHARRPGERALEVPPARAGHVRVRAGPAPHQSWPRQ